MYGPDRLTMVITDSVATKKYYTVGPESWALFVSVSQSASQPVIILREGPKIYYSPKSMKNQLDDIAYSSDDNEIYSPNTAKIDNFK